MDVEQLIAEVFERPAIWQSRHRLHRNRVAIDLQWEQIADALNTTKDAVRSRWKSLKDQYRKEVKKIMKNSSDGAGGKLTSTWPYFISLYFIKEEVISSRSSGSLRQDPEPNGEGDDSTHLLWNFSETVEISNDDDTSLVEDCGENIQVEQDTLVPVMDSCEAFNSVVPKQVSRKRKTTLKDTIAKKMLMLEEQKVELLKGNKKTAVEESEDYHFLMSLLPHFKSMAPLKKLKVRNRITQVVIEEVFGESSTS